MKNESAERAVLACVINSEICAMQSAELDDMDFTNLHYRDIFLAVQKLIKQGKKVSLPSLDPFVQNKALLIKISGESAYPSQFSVYVEELIKCRQKRDLVAACQTAIKTVEDDDSCLDTLEKSLSDIAAKDKSAVEPVGTKAMDAVVSMANKTNGISSGFPSIDQVALLRKGDLFIVAGRPSMGKTAFVTQIAMNIARNGVVAFFSLETTEEKLLHRAICTLGECSKVEIVNGMERATQKAIDAAEKISKMKLYIDDRSGLTVGQIKARCMQIKSRARQLDLIVVDYLQLIKARQRKNGTREQEVAEISWSMKMLAKDMKCPILLLSQLSRDIERRKGLPILADLRESGAIEQDADVVIFIHRPARSDSNADPKEAYAVIAKNKDGRCENVQLIWDGDFMKFSSDWTKEAEGAEEI